AGVRGPPNEPNGLCVNPGPATNHHGDVALTDNEKPKSRGSRITMNIVAMWQYLQARFGRDERGASLVEYALLVALIAVVCIAAIQFLGHSASTKFSTVGNSVNAAGS